jgi:MFS family permease
MLKKVSLKQAERRVFRIAFNDGLWDIFIGSFALQFAIGPLLSPHLGDFWSALIFLPFFTLILFIIWLVRKHVVIPRIGFVKFGPSRKKRLKKFSAMMLVANLVALIIGANYALNFNVNSGSSPMVVFGLILLIISSLAAYFLNFIRLFVYGALFLLSAWIGEWLFIHYRISHHGFPITFGITAGIIMMTGVIIFFRLLREYPVPSEESLSEEKMG